jgi:putative transposase
MYRGKQVFFTASSEVIHQLFACNRLSGEVWNACLEFAKQHHKTTGKWINQTQLQSATKKIVRLHSQSIQAVCHKYLDSRNSIHQAKKKGISTVRYPYRQKKHFNTKWIDQAFTVHANGKIELSMGNHDGKRQKPLTVYAHNLPEGDIKEIELCYDRGLYLSISYDDGMMPKENPYSSAVGIDMGEIHSFASVHENGEAVIITGRKMRSTHRLRNKKVAELQKKMSKCKKGSRQWKKYHRAKQFILSKSERQLQDACHKSTKSLVEWCIEQQTKTIYVGDVSTVAKKTKKKKKASRTHRQKLSNWQSGKMLAYLSYKAEAYGMEVKVVSEAYTSQTCPVCHTRKKPTGRTYSCTCGYERHRDLHGASNILSEQLHGAFKLLLVTSKPKYLRIA